MLSSTLVTQPDMLAAQATSRPSAASVTAIREPVSPEERSGYRQPGACRTIGASGTSLLFAAALGAMLWVPSSTLVRMVPASRLAVTFELAPTPTAPKAVPIDVPPGPLQHEQEASSANKPKAEIVPKVDVPTTRAAPAPADPSPVHETTEQPSTAAKPVEQTTAPPAVARVADVVAARANTASAEQTARANWQSLLLGHLKDFLRYPRQAQSSRQEGIALVTLTVDRRGNVLAARLDRGSGYPALDSEAVAMVRRGSPVPPPSADIGGDPIVVTIPIQFSLRR